MIRPYRKKQHGLLPARFGLKPSSSTKTLPSREGHSTSPGSGRGGTSTRVTSRSERVCDVKKDLRRPEPNWLPSSPLRPRPWRRGDPRRPKVSTTTSRVRLSSSSRRRSPVVPWRVYKMDSLFVSLYYLFFLSVRPSVRPSVCVLCAHLWRIVLETVITTALLFFRWTRRRSRPDRRCLLRRFINSSLPFTSVGHCNEVLYHDCAGIPA